MNTPYTYLLGWKNLNLYYYGVRYSKNCHPDELLVNYFSSSKVVQKMINENILPDIVEIRKTFKSPGKARIWENKVLRRLNVINDNKWINKTNNISIKPQPGKSNPMYGRSGNKHPLFGKTLSEETRHKIGQKSRLKKGNMPEGFSEKMRKINTGRKHSEESKNKISKALEGRSFTKKHKENISKNHANVSGQLNPMYGKKHSKALIKKWQKERKGKMWITNGSAKKLVSKKESKKYLLDGWRLGRK